MLNGSVTPHPHPASRKAYGCVRMHLDAQTTHTYTHKQVLRSHTHQKKVPKRAAQFSWHATCQAIPPALHRRTPTPDWLKPQPESCKPLSYRNPSLRSLSITEKKIGEKKERKERQTHERAKGITLHSDSPYLVYLRFLPPFAPLR